MAGHGDARKLRIAAANLVRLAAGDLADSRLLGRDGHARNAAALLALAYDALLAAVLASEHGWPIDGRSQGLRAIPTIHPLRDRLAVIVKAVEELGGAIVGADGRRSPEPEVLRVDKAAGFLEALVDLLASRFEIDLGGDGAAARVQPIRAEPVAEQDERSTETPSRSRQNTRVERRDIVRDDPALISRGRKREPEAAPNEEPPNAKSRRHPGSTRPKRVPTKKAELRQATARRPIIVHDSRPSAVETPTDAQPSEPPRPHPEPHAPDATSTVFWSLMDRWRIGDEEALRLVGHKGGLTKTGGRPRFRITGREALVFSLLQELDRALASLGEEPAEWLRAPMRVGRAKAASPLTLIARKGVEGARELLREVAMTSLKRSI